MKYLNKKIIQGRSVEVQDGKFEKALKKFNKAVAESGVLADLKDREFYTKPSIRRREKLKVAIKKEKARQREDFSSF